MSDEMTAPLAAHRNNKDDLLALLQIQDRDIKIRRLKEELEQKPKDVEQLKACLADMQKKMDGVREGLKKVAAEKKSLEIDLETHLEKIRKYDTQSSLVKTNDEYRALMKEIEELKKASRPLEDKILDAMEKMEDGDRQLVREGQLYKQEEQKAAQKEKTIQEEMAGIRGRLEAVKKERDGLLAGVRAEFLQRYQLLFENKEDCAIVTIEHGACGGCHMAITPQIMNEVKRAHDLIVCENCARILCWTQP